jgi:hypothetical protein
MLFKQNNFGWDKPFRNYQLDVLGGWGYQEGES